MGHESPLFRNDILAARRCVFSRRHVALPLLSEAGIWYRQTFQNPHSRHLSLACHDIEQGQPAKPQEAPIFQTGSFIGEQLMADRTIVAWVLRFNGIRQIFLRTHRTFSLTGRIRTRSRILCGTLLQADTAIVGERLCNLWPCTVSIHHLFGRAAQQEVAFGSAASVALKPTQEHIQAT